MGFISDAHVGTYQDRRTGKLVSPLARCTTHTSKQTPDRTNLHTPRSSSSINSIPSEILADIFELCQPQGDWKDPLIPTLERIVAVCSHWRAVALAAPYLWSQIKLYDPKEMHVSLVQSWLERSRTCPLMLAIRQVPVDARCGEDQPLPRTDEATNRIFVLLSYHLNRWRSLKLFLCHITDIPQLPPSSAAAPLFECLEIEDFSLTPSVARGIWATIHAYPSLQRVAWSSELNQKDFLPCLSSCDWGKLTHLTATFSVDDTLLNLLMHCTALVFLDAHEGPSTSAVISPRPPFVMPRLRTLHFRTEEALLDHLILPRLEELMLYHDEAGLRKWVDLFARSSCTLKSVNLSVDNSTTREELDAFFSSSSMSQVTELYAYEDWTSNLLVRGLTMHSDKMVIPSLQRLNLGVYNCTEGILQAMIESRISYQHTQLHFVDIAHGTYPYRTLADRSADARYLEKLNANGFNVTYNGP
ncbi:hypothetical protein VNI00_010683 [Paramarasmius palmivorus]|uniref:F-box domain-containing protein n=1 Tax=Paramarasmius palmivorus TaxID=297713 RepID=A0AAW0CIG1_9AGAR